MKIIFIMANNSSVPYFNWFAERSLVDPNYEFVFIAMYKQRPIMLDEMSDRKLKCYWVKYNDGDRKMDMIKAIPKLYSIFKKEKPDVVHTHLFDDSLPGQLAAWLAGIKIRVVTKQDTGYHWNYAPSYVRFDRLINRLATHIHAVATENEKFILEKEKANPQKVHLIRNGFPLENISNSSQERIDYLKAKFTLENRIVVGTVARLIDWKGHKIIIKAAEELVTKYPELLFIWAGTGSPQYTAELEELIKKAGLQDNIKLLDWVERKDMPSLYKCMNIYLHPAIGEPFGFAITEAFANEIPVVATRTGSTDLVSSQENCILIEENNASQIEQALKLLLQDNAVRNNIAVNGKLHAEKHLTFERMYKEHLELYSKK